MWSIEVGLGKLYRLRGDESQAAWAFTRATEIGVSLATGIADERSASGKEWPMQTTNVRQIKTALVEQAFHGTTRVRCPWGRSSPSAGGKGNCG